MSGLAIFGDGLEWLIQSHDNIELQHCLESVKLIPKSGSHHERELYGLRTQQAVARAEIEAPNRKRIICSPITSEDSRDKGRPTSWSGSLDALAAGVDEKQKRLIVIAAGNVHDSSEWKDYPDSNITCAVHDPGQSWNALTVGGITNKTRIRDIANFGNYQPVAGDGQLSPFSATSVTWEDKWPNKPDIVLEGGNAGIDSSNFATEIEDLSLLTTNHEPNIFHFSYTNATSAATAIAANMAAQLQARYPFAWPETIRALLVHSAEWTNELRAQFWDNNKTEKQNISNLLRISGYGKANLARAMSSASNHLTLIAQETIQPFQKKENSREYETKDMHLHSLPWPKQALLDLPPDTPIVIRATLSYFIEPAPGEIGWKDKYRYRSHGLNFNIIHPRESRDEFVSRMSRAARGEDYTTGVRSIDWKIGNQNGRQRGSIHSDIWETTAIEAAESNIIGIYPTIGWWKERHHLEKGNSETRYALVVSVSTPKQDVDIYTPVSIATRPAIVIRTE